MQEDFMTSASAVIAFVESGDVETFKQLVYQACQDQSWMPPVLSLEYQNVRYRLHQSAGEGNARQVVLPSLVVEPPHGYVYHSSYVADGSPDGDALQAFEWASNPPGT